MAKSEGTKVGECAKCHAPITDKHPYAWCIKCGNTLPEEVKILTTTYIERQKLQHTEEQYDSRKQEVESQIQRIIVTTAPNLEGYRVVETLDVITAECVYGMNIFKDILAGLSDVFGGRNETTQKALRDARKTCLYELKKEALAAGANAVIAIDLDYSELSGGNKSSLFLVASGTAVRVEPISDK